MAKSGDPRIALARHRAAIDAIDRKLLALLSRRGQIAQKIGAFKRANGLAIIEPSREQQVVSNLISANKGPLGNDAIERIFLGVMIEMRNLQRKE